MGNTLPKLGRFDLPENRAGEQIPLALFGREVLIPVDDIFRQI